MLTSLF
jgi:hypothetical protein